MECNAGYRGTIESNGHSSLLDREVCWARSGVVRNRKWNDSGDGMGLGRKVKHEYGGWANRKGGVSVRGI